MLVYSRLTDELAHAETLRSKYIARIASASVGGLVRLIFQGRFKHAGVFSLLRLALYFFADEVKR